MMHGWETPRREEEHAVLASLLSLVAPTTTHRPAFDLQSGCLNSAAWGEIA